MTELASKKLNLGELSTASLAVLLVARTPLDLYNALATQPYYYGSVGDSKIQEGIVPAGKETPLYISYNMDFRVENYETFTAPAKKTIENANALLKRAAAAIDKQSTTDDETIPFHVAYGMGSMQRGELCFYTFDTDGKQMPFQEEILRRHLYEAVKIRIQENPKIFTYLRLPPQHYKEAAKAYSLQPNTSLVEIMVALTFKDKTKHIQNLIKTKPFPFREHYDVVIDKSLSTEELAKALGMAPEKLMRTDVTETAQILFKKNELEEALGINRDELEPPSRSNERLIR